MIVLHHELHNGHCWHFAGKEGYAEFRVKFLLCNFIAYLDCRESLMRSIEIPTSRRPKYDIPQPYTAKTVRVGIFIFYFLFETNANV